MEDSTEDRKLSAQDTILQKLFATRQQWFYAALFLQNDKGRYGGYSV